MADCNWYQLRCKYRSRKAEKAAVEQAAEQEKWDALALIPEDLNEQTIQLVKVMALVGIPVLGLLAWVAASKRN